MRICFAPICVCDVILNLLQFVGFETAKWRWWMHKNSVMRVVVVVVILETGEEDFIVILWIYIELMSVEFKGVWNRILICDVAFGCTSCCVLAPSCWCCFRFMLFRSSCIAFCLLSTIFICNVALAFFFFCLIWMLTWIYEYGN